MAVDLLQTLAAPPEEWRAWSKIPWDREDFSTRMLAIHLDPTTNMASRNPEWVARACDWVHAEVLGGRPGRILDLG